MAQANRQQPALTRRTTAARRVTSPHKEPASAPREPVRLIREEGDHILIDRRVAYAVAGIVIVGALVAVIVSVPGLSSWFLRTIAGIRGQPDAQTLLDEVNPPDGYTLQVRYGDIGPQLLAAGAIDLRQFIALYNSSGSPLTQEEIDILTQGSDQPITINRQNAHFLLNLFWALGLTNQNAILDEGPLMENSDGEIGRFASTGGWTLGEGPAIDLYSSTRILHLTAEEQARVEEAAANTYRPCCNNSTAFADCNHGMAMLGLFELMASQGATLDEMYDAAKYFNAFWFPQHAMQLAVYFRATTGHSFAEVDSRIVVSRQYSSGSGSAAVQSWLAENNRLPQAPGGGSCGV